jgi:type I restriction enzyme S subunit
MNFTPEEFKTFALKYGDILLNEGQSRELVGRPAIYRDEVPGSCFQNTLVRYRPSPRVCSEYALVVFRAYMRTGRFQQISKQTTNIAHLSAGRFAALEFPLPPLAEQKRIVAKVDELMGLCDRWEAQEAERQKRHVSLAQAALARFEQEPTPANLTYLFHPSYDITPADLRKTILSLAVRGKLVPQDPNEEPAEELLLEIDKVRRATGRKSPRYDEPSGDTIVENARSWNIPSSWKMTRLKDVTEVVMGTSPPGETYNKLGLGMPLINGPVEFSQGPFGTTNLNQHTTAPGALCEAGDFLICVRGSTTGRTNVASTNACIGRGVAAIKPLYPDQYVRFVIVFLREQIIAMGRGIAFPSISRAQLLNLPIPLPPLAEQKRIVAKVEQLMAFVDQLEAQLAESRAKGEKLLNALVAELSG